MGRPSKHTPELAAEICRRLADGESLRSICRDEAMPSKEAVRCWCRDNPEFLVQYVRAREDQADTLVEEILEIADDGSNDTYTVEKDGREVEVVNYDHIQRSKLRVDARKWAASKLAPKKYGDRLNVDAKHEGGMVLQVVTGIPREPGE